MLYTQKKIGIWGFGITGKSAVNFLHAQGHELSVMDKKKLTADDSIFLHNKNIKVYDEHNIHDFLAAHDHILPSPGIDLRLYPQFKAKWLNELDLFYDAWEKPIIAITGSIGKTTITHLVSEILHKLGKRVATGGNIGIPMLDLVAQKDESDLAVLEVSSFQLELTKRFAPTLAIITNIYPNHLDRHPTLHDYIQAKGHIFIHQKEHEKTLLPFELKDQFAAKKTIHYFIGTTPTQEQLNTISAGSSLFYIQNRSINNYCAGKESSLITLDQLPPLSFEENWLIIASILNLYGNLSLDSVSLDSLAVPEHRLEKIATINQVDFYNDSKATTIQSTLAAIERLKNKPILLLLGGLSKGVDRTPLIAQLQGNVKKIYCFGKEAQELSTMCNNHTIKNEIFTNLESAIQACKLDMQPGDQILLSPAGSSYDLYANYMERGNHFKKLVLEKR